MGHRAKTQPTGRDVNAFVEAIPNAERRADARTLCTILTDTTGELPVLWGPTIVGFGSYRYRYKSGGTGSAPLASFAARRTHLVIYLVGGFTERHLRLLDRLGPHKTGTGCLYVKRLADIDLDVLRELVTRSIKVHRGQDRASGGVV
jgi:Domain of unknown function (DU1801)